MSTGITSKERHLLCTKPKKIFQAPPVLSPWAASLHEKPIKVAKEEPKPLEETFTIPADKEILKELQEMEELKAYHNEDISESQ
jgi:hypothetical protein